MLDLIISGALENMPPETKAGLKKVKEFIPIIDTYHSGLTELKPDELRIGYLAWVDKGKITLYQVVLAIDKERRVPYISRTLESWDVLDYIDKFTKEEKEEA